MSLAAVWTAQSECWSICFRRAVSRLHFF